VGSISRRERERKTETYRGLEEEREGREGERKNGRKGMERKGKKEGRERRKDCELH
jgi:hypothetical protein